MTTRFRSVVAPSTSGLSPQWNASFARSAKNARRRGVDGGVFRYEWSNNQPVGVDTSDLARPDCRFLLSYSGPHANFDEEHSAFVFNAITSAGYLRIGDAPVFLIERVEDAQATSEMIECLRQSARECGLGEIRVVLENGDEASSKACGCDACLGCEIPKIDEGRYIDLVQYRGQLAGAIVHAVRRGEQAGVQGAFVCTTVEDMDPAWLDAHWHATIDAAEEITPVPSTVPAAQQQPAAQTEQPLQQPSEQRANGIVKADKPSLSVATVVNGDPDAIMATITSVAENTSGLSYLDFTIVDNGSTDATPALLEELGDSVIAIRNNQAIDPAAAWTQAIGAGRGEFVLMVSNDVVVTPGWFEPLVKELQSNDSTQAVCPGVETAGQVLPSQPPAIGSGVCLLSRRSEQTEPFPSQVLLVNQSIARLRVKSHVIAR